jgi:hypothetical protein
MEGDIFWKNFPITVVKKRLGCPRDVTCRKMDIRRESWTDRNGENNRRDLTVTQSDGATTD